MSAAFGAILRRLRRQAGLSQSELAARLTYSKTHVAHIEQGIRQPPPAFAARADEVLAAGGALVALANVDRTEDSVRRRALLNNVGALAVFGAVRPDIVAEVIRTGWAGTPGDGEHWRAVADAYGRDYLTAAPGELLARLAGDLLILNQQVTDTGDPVLMAVGARLLMVQGMLTASSGDGSGAARWYATARGVAAQAGDPRLVAWLAGREAFRRGYDDLPAPGVMALVHDVAAPSVELCLARAQALARLGDRSGSTAALGDAHRAWDKSGVQDPHSIYDMPAWRLAVAGALVDAINARDLDHHRAVVEGERPAGVTRWLAQYDLAHALMLANRGEHRAGVDLALTTTTGLAPGQRTLTLRRMALAVVDAVPGPVRRRDSTVQLLTLAGGV